MRFGLDEATIEKLSKVFEANPKVDKALIFGSRAKGSYRDDSDIDIALKGYDISLNDVLQLSAALEDEGISYKVDLVNYNSIKEPALIEHIDRVGVEFYSRWKEYKLAEIAEVQTGPFGSQLHMSDYQPVGTPIMTVEHLSENRILHQNLPLVSDDDKMRLAKYTLKEGDIVFSRVGSVDRRAYVGSEEDGWMFSGRCLRIRVNRELVNPKFLSFYFGQESFKETIRNIAVGATMPSINTSILNEAKVVIPNNNIQNVISSTLSSLDDKIDLLHRQNKTLEGLAKTLFRQWFVEEAKEDWEEKELDKYIYFDPREKIDRQREYQFFDMKCLSNNSLSMAEGSRRNVASASTFRNDDTLLAKITPCLENGKTGFVMHLDEREIARGSTEFIVMRSKGMVSPYWIYCLARDEDFRESAIQSMTGTSGRQRVQIDLLKSIKVKMNETRMNEFHENVLPYFQKIKSNACQVKILTQLRDTLLPKLMSGEIKILSQ